MKRFSLKIIWLTILMLLACLALVVCAMKGFYVTAIGCTIALLSLTLYIIYMQRKALTSVCEAIELIKVSDMSDRVMPPSGSLAHDLLQRLNITFDTYKLRQQNEAIRQHYYEQILDEVDTGVVVCKDSGEITWQNRASISLLGTLRDLPQHWLSNREACKVSYTNHNITYEMVVSCRKFTIDTQSYRIVSLKDIHEVLEETEIEAWQKLVSVLTHEIMNSLTPIIGLSESAEGMDERADSALAVIHRRSKGLLEFIKNYRKITRIPQPQMESVPVQEYFSDLEQFYGDRLRCNVSPSALEVNADPRQLMQVLVNLVKNASEASDGIIELNAYRTADGNIEISVRDHGQGILPEVMDSIFVPFFTTKPQGSGIGLSLCKQIVKQHRGRLLVKSRPGHGSTFTIVLPKFHSTVK